MLSLLQPDAMLAKALGRIGEHMHRLEYMEQRMLRIEIRLAIITQRTLVWRTHSWRKVATLGAGHPWDGILERLAQLDKRLEEIENSLPPED